MSTYIHRESAKIIPFPLRPRVKLGSAKAVDTSVFRLSGSVEYDCWYHETAVEEDRGPGERGKPC